MTRRAFPVAAGAAIAWCLALVLVCVAQCGTPRYPLLAWSDPAPMSLTSRAPLFVERRSSDGLTCCAPDTLPARTWPWLEIGIQLRAIDYARPRFAPVVVATGPPTQPGLPCTLAVNRGQPGDVFVARWRNYAGAACWSPVCVGAW
jgi:hypothetical protein